MPNTPKHPQDHKPKAAEAPTTYTHVLDGKSFTLPLISHLDVPFGLKRKMHHLDEQGQVIEMIEFAADEEALAVIDTMNEGQFEEFLESWGEASGITVGESAAS